MPAWQTNGTATVNFGRDLGGLPLGDLLVTAHYYWQSRYLADLRAFNPAQRTFAYGLLNFRLDFSDAGHADQVRDGIRFQVPFGSSLFAPRTRQLDERVEVGNP